MPVLRAAACVITVLALGCSSRAAPESRARLRLWHAFSASETTALNHALAAWRKQENVTVEPIQETFARGQTMLRRTLEQGTDCPDLARIDATWLPGLASAGLVRETPPSLDSDRRWLPAAAALATIHGTRYGLPQAIDGLALVYRRQVVANLPWPPATMDELVATARMLTKGDAFGLGVRNDGYWFVAFLRAWGGSLVDPDSGRLGIDTPASVRALERFAALFGSVAPRPPPPGTTAQDEARRFRNGTLAVVITGPWAIAELTGGDTEGIAVAALPGAPLGGQVLVVPACAEHPGLAWKLAHYLTSPALQADWARRLGLIPTSRDSLDAAGAFAREFYKALASAQPLPRHPITSELFEDLSPAVSRVVAGDATAAEAAAGVARAWSKLLGRHNIVPTPHEPEALRDQGQNHSPEKDQGQREP